jgi:hypothetical protein
MSNKNKPDFMWILVLVVVLGAASTQLLDNGPNRMPPQQAGIIVQ